VVDVWYLIGWANYLLDNEDGHSNARSYLNKAKKLYTKKKYDDTELMKHIEELLEKLGAGRFCEVFSCYGPELHRDMYINEMY